jgi:cysteine desulfurase/selenocysteine lyase
VAAHIHGDRDEIIFTKGTTESLNLVADSWGKKFLHGGDEVLVTAMEHHSNLLPWMKVAGERGADVKICDILPGGGLDLRDFQKKLGPKTRMVAIAHVSNVLGTINPLEELIPLAKKFGACVTVDGAPWMASGPQDVKKFGGDFYAFSGHKVFAPMGIGVLYGRREWLERMPPYQCGGGMVEWVREDAIRHAAPPEKFEAGTPPIPGALGLRCALEFLRSMDWAGHGRWAGEIRRFLGEELGKVPGIRRLGNWETGTTIHSLVHEAVHGHDLAAALASKNICVRAGNHCAQLLLSRLQVPASLRISFAPYNTLSQAEELVKAIRWAIRLWS